VQEYSGLATTDVVDVSSGEMAPGLTQSVAPGPIITSASCDLVVAAYADGHAPSQAVAVSGSWVLRSSDNSAPAAAVDNAPSPVARSTVLDPIMTLSAGADVGWVAAQVAFRAAGTTALTQPDQIAFATPARAAAVGGCSPVVTIESRIATTPTNTATGMLITLGASNATFFADPLCAFPIETILIGAGRHSASFYFSRTAVGTITIGAISMNLPGIQQVENGGG
jgi:hypothetical protein